MCDHAKHREPKETDMNYRTITLMAAVITTTVTPTLAAGKQGWWGFNLNTNRCEFMTKASPAEVVRYYHGKILWQNNLGAEIEVTMNGKKTELAMYSSRENCERDQTAAAAPAPAAPATPAAPQTLEAATANDVKEISITPDHFGSFSTAVTINGITELGIVDTGADRVSLSAESANRLGFHLSDKDYTDRYSTANGVAYSAPVILDHLQIGSFIFDNVPAEVAKPGAQDGNLIGTSVLKDLRVEISHNIMTLRRDS
jgi:clan AA aspartic protease (TIGR02281 family)